MRERYRKTLRRMAALSFLRGPLPEGERAIEAIYHGAFGRDYAGSHASAERSLAARGSDARRGMHYHGRA
jgi:hypothetical protein